MEVILQTYYIILPIIVTALVGWVGVLLKDQKKRDKDREEALKKKNEEAEDIRKNTSMGIMLVLRYMLKRYHEEYMIQGEITYNQYKEWMDIYKVYESLDGNSIAEDWNSDIESLKKCEITDSIPIFERLLKQCVQK